MVLLPANAGVEFLERQVMGVQLVLSVVRRLLPEWGTTYGPPGDGPFPAVVVLHGSEGGLSGWSHRSAAILAASGFLAYPHPYSKGGNAWNAGSIRDVELTRTLDAMAALRQFPACNGNVALHGVSRGAEHALLATCLAADEGLPELPQALACLAAPDVVCGAFDARSYRDAGDPGWQPWDPADCAWLWRGQHERLRPTTPIPVEAFKGPMFLAAGLKDQTWSPQMTRRLEERRLKAGLPVDAYYYENEGHLPGSDGENHHHQLLVTFLDKHLFAGRPA